MELLLLAPFFLIRFTLLFLLDKTAVRRAAHFAPMETSEKPSYWLYQLSNAAIFICMFFLQVKFAPRYLFIAGVIIYLAGNLLLVISMFNFAHPSANGINLKGLYRVSRNPMYIAYFVYFLGCALLTQSLILFALVLVFQVSSHQIILAEERWCIKSFGEEYLQYMKKTKRYI